MHNDPEHGMLKLVGSGGHTFPEKIEKLSYTITVLGMLVSTG